MIPGSRSPRGHLHLVGMLGFTSGDMNQPSLPTPFVLPSVSVSVSLALSHLSCPFSYISFHTFSPKVSVFSLCSFGFISALLVLSTIYSCINVSIIGHLWFNDLWTELQGDRLKLVCSPDIILCGRLGSKHQLTTRLSK